MLFLEDFKLGWTCGNWTHEDQLCNREQKAEQSEAFTSDSFIFKYCYDGFIE